MRSSDAPRDHARWGILASNLLALLVALAFRWDVRELLWPYWLQSVIIGAFAARRMRVLKSFSVEGFRINDRSATETDQALRRTVGFFILHYGFFHLGYFIFLWATSWQLSRRLTTLDLLGIAALCASFIWSHWRSHREHVAADLAGKPNLGKLMFMPYVRIIPMHLVILLGAFLGGGAGAVILFVALKTLVDLGMHRIEHRELQAQSPRK